MQPVTNTTNTYSTGYTATTEDNEPASAGANDFQTFLTLLTAQMKNQDPLKPMESTEFVAQLASFSSVEQQIRTNDQLELLVDLFSVGPSTGLAEWIGKEVRHPGSANFTSAPIEANVSPLVSADEAYFVVKDHNGQVIYRTQIETSATNATWNGTDNNGEVAPEGRYSFEVQSYTSGNLARTDRASVFDLVTEVRLEHGSEVLVFSDGTTMRATDATAMRLPLS